MNLHFPPQESKTATGHLILEWDLQNCGPRENFALYKSIVSDVLSRQGKANKEACGYKVRCPYFQSEYLSLAQSLSLRL